MLPRIANFDDLDPLKAEPAVEVVMVPPGSSLPADAGLVVLPGTKSTIADLLALRENGWDRELVAHVKRGGHVLGICGGFQMLGRRISDPAGIEGNVRDIEGLGLLDIETMMEPEKVVRNVEAVSLLHDEPLEGYEIHIGRTSGRIWRGHLRVSAIMMMGPSRPMVVSWEPISTVFSVRIVSATTFARAGCGRRPDELSRERRRGSGRTG